RTVTARRPTGADQRAWAQASFADLQHAVYAAASSLLLDADVAVTTESDVHALEEALAANDPLSHFSVSAVCPYCGARADYEIDLDALAMQWLYAARTAMIETVHALAQSYHWSEAEIFAIAPWRRDQYLALVERDERIR
ncbi:MAG: hypothetical protein ACREND_02820, partial [Gemmatimonadaceae bacterium]